MKNHNFCYNYGFLADWLKANPEIKRYGLLDMLDMSYYKTLQNWMDGVTMMPLTQMMKFCNLFNVPITAFFLDDYADEESVFNAPNAESMTEPAGGWKESDRTAGIKSGDPRTERHQMSQLPAYCKSGHVSNNAGKADREDAPATAQQEFAPLDAKALLDLEHKHSDERQRLLDMIENLQKQNAALLQMLGGAPARPYQVVEEYEPDTHYGMVAEPEGEYNVAKNSDVLKTQ